MTRPRVLHATVEVAGQLALSAYGLREIGVPARSFARPHPFAYPVAPDILPGGGRVAWLRSAAKAIPRHDVFHFYFAQSFLPEQLGGVDARLLRRAGRRVVVEFLGSDVRTPSIEAQRNPHYVQLDGEDDLRAARRLRRWSTITDGHAIICDRGMAAYVEPYFTHVHVVPFRVDSRAFVPAPPRVGSHTPVIVHAPSTVAAKGTPHVRAAIQALRDRGADVEYVELHGVSRESVARACATADLVVDQLCSGSHGVFAVEAMCMAKPVIGNILPSVRPSYPDDFPIIQATPETLSDVLHGWLQRPRERHELGLASRAYAERLHDVRAVARQLLDVYAQLPGRRGR